MAPEKSGSATSSGWKTVRIVIRRAVPGWFHPVGRRAIERVLRLAGPRATYGLERIELVDPPVPTGRTLALGRLEAPGCIRLYAQPRMLWRIPALLASRDAKRLRAAGAQVELDRALGVTRVNWPAGCLESFMLLHVLVHELGHHILQHESRKDSARIARTRDHEAFAERYAAAFRQAWYAEQERP